MRTVTRIHPKGVGAGATARWHPYLPPKSTPNSSPQLLYASPASPNVKPPYPHTPTSTTVSTSDSFHGASNRRTKLSPTALPSYYSNHKERQDTKRAQKDKFENALKELAVQRLCDIWKETSYVIHSTSPASSWYASDSTPLDPSPRPTILSALQLPSPLTPSTHTFASPQPVTSKFSSALPSTPRRIPIRAFVHEVLRRSKTMWPALQIALCYLDAAKCKVPDAIAEAKQGEGLQAAEVALDKLFGSASASDLAGESQGTLRRVHPCTPPTYPSPPNEDTCESVQQTSQNDSADAENPLTIPQAPAVAPVDATSSDIFARTRRRRVPPAPPAPLPPRPSPLLCPRRMFVAALILATKFTQDRVYSNRAWAKISGLDAREIGRCERALGEALEWRLWVGKGVADEPTSFLRNFLLAEESLARSKANGIARSKSDGELLAIAKQDIAKAAWSSCDSPKCDPNTALKRSLSLSSADNIFGSPATSTPMLSDPATLVLTPANADLDAMDLQPTPLLQHSVCSAASSSFSSAITPTSSFSSNEFSFTPAVGIPTPPFSYSPEIHVSDCLSASDEIKPTTGYRGTSLDPIMGTSCGVEGTFDMGIDEIVGNF